MNQQSKLTPEQQAKLDVMLRKAKASRILNQRSTRKHSVIDVEICIDNVNYNVINNNVSTDNNQTKLLNNPKPSLKDA